MPEKRSRRGTIVCLALVGVAALVTAFVVLHGYAPPRLEDRSAGEIRPNQPSDLSGENTIGDDLREIEVTAQKKPQGRTHSGLAISTTPSKIEFDPLIKNERLINVYDGLVARAEGGDMLAVRSLVAALERCRAAHDDNASLANALSEVEQNGKLTFGWSGAKSRHVRPAHKQFFNNFLKEIFTYCEGIPRDERERYSEWAIVGAEAGDEYSIGVAANILPEGPDKYELLSHVWEQHKSTDVAWRLSDYYAQGVPKQDGTREAPDYKKAYAFYLVGSAASKAFNESKDIHNSVVNIRSTSAQNRKDQLAIHLSPYETEEAEKMAEKMVATQ